MIIFRLNTAARSIRPCSTLTFMLGIFVPLLSCLSLAQSTRSLDQLTMAEKIDRAKPFHLEHSESVEPFTIIDNVHYVGAKNIASYLITTPDGHFLLDTGVREMGDSIRSNIKKLGFEPRDIKILLSSHAHFDHVQGHEEMRKTTGAKVMAVGDDAKALQEGKDLSPLGFEGWDPVEIDTVLKHGDVVSLGATSLTAINVPGHTQGCTVWTMNVEDNKKTFELAFFGCSGPNNGVKITDNEKFPNLVEDTLLGYQRLKTISPDIYLNGHPHELFETRMPAIRSGERPHPILTQQPWSEFVNELETNFQQRIQ